MKNDTKIWEQMAADLSGELNSDERLSLQKEIEKKDLKKDYDLMKMNWNEINKQTEDNYSDTQLAWSKLHSRMERDGLLEEELKNKKINMNYFLRVAAVIALIFAVGIPAFIYTSNQANLNSVVKHHANDGISTIDLPDGSRVFLNEGASIQYPKSFNNDRKLELEGEAYFKVMSDPNRPFRVNSSKVKVTVLGTSFNVKDSKEQTEVFVESGKVQVEHLKSETSSLLEAGDYTIADQSLHASELENPNYLSWKTKEFKFTNAPLIEIIKTLSDAYHVNVEIEIENIQDFHLTSTYKDQSFDAILSTICLAHQLSFEKANKVYTLHSN